MTACSCASTQVCYVAAAYREEGAAVGGHLMLVQQGQELIAEVLPLACPVVLQGFQRTPMSDRVQCVVRTGSGPCQGFFHLL